jgi:integrase/recombinase XerD
MEIPSLRSETGLRNRCIMGLMYEAGLRVGEALALKPRDVVIEEKRVEVLRGKGSKPRTVYFRSDDLGILLERWKEIRPASEYLFSTVRSATGKGEQLDPRGFRITFKSYVKKAGLDPNRVTPHVLRHTCATEMLRRGVNIRIIQEALGHAWVATTQIYTHVVNEDVRRAMTCQ